MNERVIYKQLVIRRFGWWFRLYLGGSGSYRTWHRRMPWRWDTGMSQGVTIRLRPAHEQVAGIQWRRLSELDR